MTEIPTKRGEEGERWNVRFNDCGFKFTIRSEEELDSLLSLQFRQDGNVVKVW